jgi:hypothetical protein
MMVSAFHTLAHMVLIPICTIDSFFSPSLLALIMHEVTVGTIAWIIMTHFWLWILLINYLFLAIRLLNYWI